MVPYSFTEEQISMWRSKWLRGVRLRAIADEYGVSHMTVYKYLVARYGANVVNIKANSLARGLLRDYTQLKSDTWADTLPKGTEYYYSYKQDKVVTRTKHRDLLPYSDHLAYEAPEQTEPLRLPYVLKWLAVVCCILHGMNEHVHLQDDDTLQTTTKKAKRV